MSAIVEMRDGYGWTVDSSQIESDENGLYMLFSSTDTNPVKTIYIDEQKIAPVYIFWQCRIYNDNVSATNVELTIDGLCTKSPITTEAITIESESSKLVTVEGYATSDVTVEIESQLSDLKIYFLNETGI